MMNFSCKKVFNDVIFTSINKSNFQVEKLKLKVEKQKLKFETDVNRSKSLDDSFVSSLKKQKRN